MWDSRKSSGPDSERLLRGLDFIPEQWGATQGCGSRLGPGELARKTAMMEEILGCQSGVGLWKAAG